jgi:hypothetical protein
MFQSDQTEVERSVKCGSVESGQNNKRTNDNVERERENDYITWLIGLVTIFRNETDSERFYLR